MTALPLDTIDAAIAEASAALEPLRQQMETFPFHLRSTPRFLEMSEERRKLLKRLDLLRQLAQLSE